jgi:hypothetical protein
MSFILGLLLFVGVGLLDRRLPWREGESRPVTRW